MAQISINHLYFAYKQYLTPIFTDISFSFDTTWNLGLIGRNGRGKTTLLRLLKGDLSPDKGHITSHMNMCLFPYDFETPYQNTLDVMLESIGQIRTMENAMERDLALNNAESLARYADTHNAYLAAEGYSARSRIKKELALFSMSESLLSRDFSTLSGGEQTRLKLLVLFLRPNSYVLMDEPTNHLDITARKTLLSYLKKKQGFILVSHDRMLLDGVTDHIMAINKSDITIEKGNYATWKNNVELKEAFENRTKERLEREISSLEKLAQDKRDWSGRVEGKHYEFRSTSRGYDSRSAALMRHAKSAELKAQKNLDEKRGLLKNFEEAPKLALAQMDARGTLVVLSRICFSYGVKPIINHFSCAIQAGDILWIRGKNGTGKTTLLKLIEGSLVPQSGSIYRHGGLKMSFAYQHCLHINGSARDFFKTKEEYARFVRICGLFDLYGTHLSRPVETLSSGEQKKLDIARALAMDNQLLLMDEPLNFMDILFREQLFEAIKTYRPTMVFIEHDTYFGEGIANKTITLA